MEDLCLEDEGVQRELGEMARIYYRLPVGVVFVLGAVVVGFFVDRFLLGWYFFTIVAPLVTLVMYIRVTQCLNPDTQDSASGPTQINFISASPPEMPKELGIPQKPDKRRDFQNLYDLLVNSLSREQFSAWFEEAEILEAKIENETDEVRNCVADIKREKQRYRKVMAQLPDVANWSEEELENLTGRASKLRDLATEITSMKTHLPNQIDKLHFLLEHRTQ